MKQKKNRDRKQEPEKTKVANPNELYGTEERPTRPKGADRMNQDFAKPGADQDIIQEIDRSGKRKGRD
jgi:hypothetical protein